VERGDSHVLKRDEGVLDIRRKAPPHFRAELAVLLGSRRGRDLPDLCMVDLKMRKKMKERTKERLVRDDILRRLLNSL